MIECGEVHGMNFTKKSGGLRSEAVSLIEANWKLVMCKQKRSDNTWQQHQISFKFIRFYITACYPSGYPVMHPGKEDGTNPKRYAGLLWFVLHSQTPSVHCRWIYTVDFTLALEWWWLEIFGMTRSHLVERDSLRRSWLIFKFIEIIENVYERRTLFIIRKSWWIAHTLGTCSYWSFGSTEVVHLQTPVQANGLLLSRTASNRETF